MKLEKQQFCWKKLYLEKKGEKGCGYLYFRILPCCFCIISSISLLIVFGDVIYIKSTNFNIYFIYLFVNDPVVQIVTSGHMKHGPSLLLNRNPLNTDPWEEIVNDTAKGGGRDRGVRENRHSCSHKQTPTHSRDTQTLLRTLRWHRAVFCVSFPSSSSSAKMPLCNWLLVLSLTALTGRNIFFFFPSVILMKAAACRDY